MKNFTSIHDVHDLEALLKDASCLKQSPFAHEHLGKHKTLGLVFFNSSLRTRLSTQKAAMNLGMNVVVMNIGTEGWALEFQDGAVMNGPTVEHIRDAAAVMGLYCDILGVRCFPTLSNQPRDDKEVVLQQFIRYVGKPVVSLESATLHPLQSLADLMTIKEHQQVSHPKIVLTWAPHIKALPQVVANSFAQWMLYAGYELTITHPPGYELNEVFTRGAHIEYNQQKALQDADFIYVKNWSSYTHYGQVLGEHPDWMLNAEKLLMNHEAKIMHCLPVRRNVELPDELIDSPQSLILDQALNRVFAAQAVLKQILTSN